MATVAVVGATGNLGGKIVSALLARGTTVHAIVRAGSSAGDKITQLEQRGVKVFKVDMASVNDVSKACEGASCVVSAIQGLRDVIVDTQTVVLDAAVKAGVKRFIPSDYSLDFNNITKEENRNLAFRKEFQERLKKASISSTSILNGGFLELLTYNIPLFNFPKRSIGYGGSPDQKLDFTHTNNVAEYTAAAALDPSAPAILRIAGDSFSPRELAKIAEEVTNEKFELANMGTLEAFYENIQKLRAADKEGEEKQEFPQWQMMQYMHNMFSGRGKLNPLDNNRYPGIKWTTARDIITGIASAQKK